MDYADQEATTIITDLNDPKIQERFGADLEQAQQEIELINGAAPEFDRQAFLDGQQTPVFFGSAINNFGVQEVLDTLVDLAPPPGSRQAIQREIQPDERNFPAWCSRFKPI